MVAYQLQILYTLKKKEKKLENQTLMSKCTAKKGNFMDKIFRSSPGKAEKTHEIYQSDTQPKFQ